MKRFLILVFALVLVLGCGPNGGPPKKLASAALKHQDDIPVPVGYTYAPEKSTVEKFSSFRLCEMLYRSPPDAAHGMVALKEFYSRMMPKYAWEEVKDVKTKPYVMIFKKTTAMDEYCRVELYRTQKTNSVFFRIGNKDLALAVPQ